ncbi:hypothetical protein ACMD2_17739 [Ananas comosus]|uniref:Uncharacterized protein n=1 Tax=Ananas comosus TaxID=4615 RepID=A0A199UUF2_ANACO|nr:hypothetical protein ACMD2_17739 [Ananas comosus]
MNSWSKEFSEIHDHLSEGSFNDSGLTRKRRRVNSKFAPPHIRQSDASPECGSYGFGGSRCSQRILSLTNELTSWLSAKVKILLAGELDLDGADVLANGAIIYSDTLAARVDLLRVDAILGVEVLHLAIRKHTIERVVNLVLGPQPRAQRQALLLARQLQQVLSLPHDRSPACRHLEHLLLWRRPRDHIEFFDLRLPQQAPRAASEDWGGGVRVQLRRGEARRGLRFRCGGLLIGCGDSICEAAGRRRCFPREEVTGGRGGFCGGEGGGGRGEEGGLGGRHGH